MDESLHAAPSHREIQAAPGTLNPAMDFCALLRDPLAPPSPVWLHRGRSFTQPNVCGYEIEGRRFVVKDFRPRLWPIRRLWGRWILRREWARLTALQGLAGIPRLLGWVDADAFAMEWIHGERLPHRKQNWLEPVFFDRLMALVEAMHARGISHGDLRRKNILVTRDQQPYLIDFATAYQAGPTPRSRRWLAKLCEVDRLTVLKLKAYYCPDALTADERQCLDDQPLSLRLGRFLRKRIYRPVKPRRWRQRWARWRRALFGRPDSQADGEGKE
ncbi:MAG: phosphotransferase [Candidatus Sumerlaeia bacterium]|nr:phosphotransferase [Candidatus Sumerlaeia bacterium]